MDGLVRKMGIGIGWDIDNSGLVKANNQTDGLVDSANQGSHSFKGLSNAGLMAGNTIQRAFNGAKKAISSGINRLKDVRYQLAGMAAAGTAAITQSVFSAGDAQETVNKFNVVFGEAASQTREWADKYSAQIGRSKYATYDWLNSFQDVLVPMGLARDEAAGLSKEMVTLAADLGSFNNIATADAARAMQSALVGNHEAVRNLGIQLSATQLDLVAQREGYQKSFQELDALTKMQLRFQEMIRQSSDAVDDATRTAGELNNQWLRFKGNLDELNKGMGFSFIPTFRRGLILINEFLETLKDSEKLKTGAKILGIATAVVGLGAAIGFAAAAWNAIGGFFTLTNFAVAGALIGLVLIVDDLWTALQGGDAVLTPVVEWFRKYKNIILGVVAIITGFFVPAILSTAIPAISKFGLTLFVKGQTALWGFSNGIWKAITASFAFWKALVTKAITGVVSFAASLATTAWSALTTFAAATWGAVTAAWSFTTALLANPITLVIVGIVALGAAIWLLWKNWDKVTAWISSTWSGFVDLIGPGVDKAGEWLYGFIDVLVGWWDSIKSWFADNFDFGGLIRSGLESAINILPGFLQDKARGFLGFDNNNAAEDEIEKEAQQTQRQIQNNNRSVNNNVKVGEIKVEAADNPKETGKAVRKELETFLGMEAAEAGV